MTDRIAYSADEVAEALKLSVNRVYELAQKGEIPAVKVGALWRFPIVRINEWMATDGVLAEVSTANHGRAG